MRILLLADIHGNMPALEAIDLHFADTPLDCIVNCGDTLVYAPFPNQVLRWLRQRKAISILGNTDKKVIKLLKGKDFSKPSNPEKRVMYTHTARQLTKKNRAMLRDFPKSASVMLPAYEDNRSALQNELAIFHGSPARHHEFLFDTTPEQRFTLLAKEFPYRAIVTGHSHTPYHRIVENTHFINPGSVGRMFDGNQAASCAMLDCDANTLTVTHFRISYDVREVMDEIGRHNLPAIYQQMYRLGKKLN